MRTKLLLPCLCILLLLAACSSSNASSSTGKKDPSSIHVAFVAPTSSQDFAVEEANGARYAAAGKLFADELISKLPANASGNVVLGVPGLGTPPLVQRGQGVVEEFKAKLPNVKVVGPFNTDGVQTVNFNEWNNIVKAHPGALAYFGTGNNDAVSLAKIKESNHGNYLTGGFDLETSSLQAVASGVNFALLDPEHFLKGYIAMKLLIEHALNNKAIPEGWWNPGSLIVNQGNVEQVLKRQESLSTRGAFFQPIADAEFADPSKYIQPLSTAK